MAHTKEGRAEKGEKSSACDACHVGQALGKADCPLRAGFRWVKGGLFRLVGKGDEDRTKS